MSAGIKHPFTGALYERHGDGNPYQIKVTDSDVGKTGIFTYEGEWIEGDLRYCDPQLCGWVAGPLVANHRLSESAPDR